MEEDLERMMTEFVAGLSPEEYERWGPALREVGLAIAESRQAEREVRRMQVAYEGALEELDRWRDARDRALEDLERAVERSINARRLLDDALGR